MKGSFNTEEVTCVQQLLSMVSHGNAIIAEILRLKDNIPSVFRLDSKEEQLKYNDIVTDFTYFKNSELIEKKIASNPILQELDDDFKETNLSIVTRFYSAFESIYQYVNDLNSFLEQLNDGFFIQQSLDTLFLDSEGKQLLCESVYLYGCMLLVLEAYIPGNVRERLLVMYHRAAVSHHQTNLDSVCKLLRDTGFRNVPGYKRPSNYPDELFKRILIDDMFIEMIIGRLRSEDIYNQVKVYPLPDHRSTALATQASMLVVCLFFSSNTLTSESAKMREVVDKYFPDNWVVSLYMGLTMNLIDAWDPYKAAKSALSNTVNSKNIKDNSQKHAEQMKKLHAQIDKLLNSSAFKEERFMDNMNKILNLVRESNVTLRWLMIHTIPSIFCDNNKKCRQVRDQIIADAKFQHIDLFNLLLSTSLLELFVKEFLRNSLDNKELKWDEQQKEASERIKDLVDVFSGVKPIARVDKNENLCNWFKAINRQIDSLSRDDYNQVTKKIIQLIQALEDVQEFHQLDSIMQVKQWLNEASDNLKDMVRGGSFTEDSLVALQICTDLSYGWYAARPFVDLGREVLKKDPAVVSHMRAIFLKQASALEIPLLRINQATSPDLLSVSQYYSQELVRYVKEVLQIIPETVFSLLAKIMELQTSVIKELPTRLDKDKLKEYSQLEQRMEVAKLTHSISIFTSGILKMRSTLVGVICIDPKQLLEDGIRCEVSKLVAAHLRNSLCNGSESVPLPARLSQLAHHMDGYRRSFEYIQDYINIHGLKIWQEEVTKIINEGIEEECAKISRMKLSQGALMSYKSPNNIFSCLLRDIFVLTDPKTTVYIEHNNTWYDFKTHKETARLSIFGLIHRGIGALGMRALARLAGSCVAVRLNYVNGSMQSTLTSFQLDVPSPQLPVPNAVKFYSQAVTKVTRTSNQLLEWIIDVGMAQLVIRHINYQLNTCCKFDSTHLESALRAVNRAIMSDVRVNYEKSSEFYADLLPEINEMMHCVGLSEPYKTVYIEPANNYNVAQIVFLFVIIQLPKMEYVSFAGTLMAKRSGSHIDGAPFLVGIITVLNQYHKYTLLQFVLLLCQYIISYIDAGINLRTPEFPSEAHVAMKFLEYLCRTTKIPQSFVETVIPVNVLSQYEFMVSKTI